MFRRLKFFGFGFLISILLLSIGPNNRLKETFISYINYFNINKRVIFHLDKGEETNFSSQALCQMVYYQINKEKILSILKEGKINFDLSDKRAEPCQVFVVENLLNGKAVALRFNYCAKEDESELVSFWFEDEGEECVN